MAMAKTGMSWQTRLASVFTLRSNVAAAMHSTATGGIALARNKPGLEAVGTPIADIPLPSQLVIPLLDYARREREPCVTVNSAVNVGMPLATGIICPANGRVSAIEPRPIIHPSRRSVLSVVIDVDLSDAQPTRAFSPIDCLTIERLEQAAVAGLGGAGFSMVRKLLATQQSGAGIHTLLVNAVECEPLISCDEALIRSDAARVAAAIRAMTRLTRCQSCIIAIEQDKTEAIAELRGALANLPPDDTITARISIRELPAVYPSGAEPVLLQRALGLTVERDTHASELGVLCLNVATLVAAHRAQAGYPMISRIITVAGSHALRPVNVRVRFGTSIAHVLQHTGNTRPAGESRIRAGGPLSGFDLHDTGVPVTVQTNCIGIEGPAEQNVATACIRCAQCSDVCPVGLLPQQLHWYAANDDLDAARRFGLDTCIECGCCDLVCPSSIELTSAFRYARSASREQRHQQQQAELAKERHEKRQLRLQSREREARLKREQKKAQLATPEESIAQALARARARRKKS